ncbi:hypothetical protein UA08_00524 [Talaromyces atroroseus]|uniref:Zn(2)-C6 fungal-type domain-containing protein n=1 Tax=Talaromyces atroroseus TaxID=1441469 RepID=A0A225ASY1_TALAT|nr:hypothetical protein UA08_00524 [Talaromyces atroroseus]OKL64711.1 hypothetical protein UA08_00524 [Talaromyces atroroseus]
MAETTSATADTTVRAVRRRRRPPRSCVECRRRKVKCDRKEPCRHCLVLNKQCIYSDEASQSEKRAESITAPRLLPSTHFTPRQMSESVTTTRPDPSHFRHLEADRTSTLISPLSTAESQPNEVTGRFPSTAENKERQINALDRRVQTLERALSLSAPGSVAVEKQPSSGPSGAHEARSESSSVSDKSKATLNKSRLFGPTHWTNDLDEFKRVSEFMRVETIDPEDSERIRHLKLKIRDLLQKCKFLAKGIKASRPTRTRCLLSPEPALPEKSLADTMARLYISRFESVFRILHIPSFWSQYEQYWRDPADSGDDVQYTVQLVIAIGFSLYRDSYDSDQVCSAMSQWVYAAQAWLSAPMEKDRLCIRGLQVQCLLILARQSLSVGGDLIWIAMGTLVRTAMQLGLHRDPRQFTKMSLLQAEIRRRLWATVMEMNVQAALDGGMPPNISLHDFDTEPPSNINDVDIDDRTELILETSVIATDTSLQRFLFSALRSRLEILRLMNGISSELTQAEVITLTTDIKNACRECRTHIQVSEYDAEEQVFRHNLADLLLRRFLLSLHRPLANRGRTSPLFYFSRKVVYDSATALLLPPQSEDFTHLVLRGSGIFKNRMIHVSLALASELLIEIEEEEGSPTSILNQPWNYKSMLMAAVQEARRQSAQRMRFGETNVRLHMKLSIVLSQAEDLIPGQSRQEQMIQSAKDSLEMACNTIKAQLSVSSISSLADDEAIRIAGDGQLDFTSPFLDLDDILQTSDFNADGDLFRLF